MNREKLIGNLMEGVTRLSHSVGFERIDSPASASGYEPPAGGALWRSSYALLCVCPVAAENIEGARQDGAFWLDDLLSEHEAKGRPMDGYLLLALESPPSVEVEGAIRVIEQDAAFCRKHVLWRKKGSWEDRLERVTVFALAEVPNPAKPAKIPELPDKAEEVWEIFQKTDNIRAVVRDINDQIEAKQRENRR